MGDWVAFWDSEHSIYVNARHRDVHYRTIAEHIRAQLASLQASPSAVALDYGCGEALHADLVAQATGRLILVEAAPKVRAGLAARFADNPGIAVRAPEDLAAEPDASYDVIVMHSVAQYLTPVEFDVLLALFRRLLKPDGHLILGDILPPNVPAWVDARALLRFARANGFLVAAVAGLVRTVLSDYWRLRSRIGLTRYGEPAIIRKLAAAGFSATRARANIGHNSARMTFAGAAGVKHQIIRKPVSIGQGCRLTLTSIAPSKDGISASLQYCANLSATFSPLRMPRWPGGGAATRGSCKTLEPGSNPGRASNSP